LCFKFLKNALDGRELVMKTGQKRSIGAFNLAVCMFMVRISDFFEETLGIDFWRHTPGIDCEMISEISGEFKSYLKIIPRGWPKDSCIFLRLRNFDQCPNPWYVDDATIRAPHIPGLENFRLRINQNEIEPEEPIPSEIQEIVRKRALIHPGNKFLKYL